MGNVSLGESPILYCVYPKLHIEVKAFQPI